MTDTQHPVAGSGSSAVVGEREGLEIDYAGDMRLPEGETCGSCVHCRRCCVMFGHVPEDTSCDFYPSRFRLAATRQEGADDDLR